MKQRTIQTLYAYWNKLRAGRVAPRRLDIEPARIGSILPETFMLERTDPNTFRYRLAGTRLCEIFRAELRGTNILDGWAEPDRIALARHLGCACEQGAGILLTIEASAGTKRRVHLEAILLPLMHSGNAMERLIGAMTAMSSPHWLGHEHLTDKRLIRHEQIWPSGSPQALVERTWDAPFLPAGPRVRVMGDERRSFRVLDGGRDKE